VPALHMFDRDGNEILVNERKLKGLVGPPPPDGYLNILLLGDGYAKAERQLCTADIAQIIRRIYRTPPFAQLSRAVNFFSRFEPSTISGVPIIYQQDTAFRMRRIDISDDFQGRSIRVDEQRLFDYIAGLTFENQALGLSLTGGDTWLNPGSKSFGMVGLFGRCLLDAGSAQWWQGGNDTSYPGGQLRYFGYANTDLVELTNGAIHELGHLFGLGDEYEEHERDAAGNCAQAYLYYPRAAPDPSDGSYPTYDPMVKWPNVAMRWELLPELRRSADDMRIELDPSSLNEPPSDFRWLRYMSVADRAAFGSRIKTHSSWDPGRECDKDLTEYLKDTAFGAIYLTEGADHFRRNAFRPARTCMMHSRLVERDAIGGSIAAPFCKICYWTIRDKIDPTNFYKAGEPWR
jgi:hypothetical protein